MDLSQQIKNIDLFALVEIEAGCGLKSGMMPCPFSHHDDKQPSFKVFSDNHFKCFGCGIGGDAVDFIQGLHDLSFKEALRHLGIEAGPVTPDTRKRIAQAGRRRRKKRAYEKRRRDLLYTLGVEIRRARKALSNIKNESQMESGAELFHKMPFWEYCWDVLFEGNEQEVKNVMRDLRELSIIKRRPLFKPDFNYRRWLRDFENGRTHRAV